MIMDTLYKKLLWLLLLLVICPLVWGQEEASRNITKTYTMNNLGKLHLENKYGNININGWDKDEVFIEIAITVNHRKKEHAEELLKRIQPIAKEGDNFVSFGYEIVEKSSGFFTTLFEKTDYSDLNRSNIQIDFTVNMPKKAALKVTNTFGDVLIEDWTGKLKALVEHGDIWVRENLDNADITLRYGKLRAQNINYFNVGIKNGELDMGNSKSMRLNSSGTDISLAAITALEIYSNKDDITIKEVSTISGNLKFSTLELNRLIKEVDMTLRITDFRVAEIASANANISIKQESSEISLNITGFSHQFTATLEQGLVRLPKSFENVDSKMLDKSKKLREIKASYRKDAHGRISISGKKGVVLLKEL